MTDSLMIEGIVAFSNLTAHDVYEGKDTGNYTLTIGLDAKAASVLEDHGVKVKDYEGTPQRKFKSKFTVDIIDIDGAPVTDMEIPYGSKVRILYTFGQSHPSAGIPVYMQKVRVLEMAEKETPTDF